MPTTTPWQSLPVMTDTDDPNIPEDVLNLAKAIEKRLVSVYSSTTDRDAKTASGKSEGNVAYTTNDNRFWVYNGSSWVSMFPQVTSGTGAPSGGVNGDIYFRV